MMKISIKPAMQLRNSILALAVAWIFLPGLLKADSTAGTVLVVEVLPDLRLEASAPSSWNTVGEQQSLLVPVRILLRLNGGTTGNLSISLSEDAASGASPVQVETGAGAQRITKEPVPLTVYSASGVYEETVQILRVPSVENATSPATLVLRLQGSDGALAGTKLVVLP